MLTNIPLGNNSKNGTLSNNDYSSEQISKRHCVRESSLNKWHISRRISKFKMLHFISLGCMYHGPFIDCIEVGFLSRTTRLSKWENVSKF